MDILELTLILSQRLGIIATVAFIPKIEIEN